MAEATRQPIAWREVLLSVGGTLAAILGAAMVIPLTDGYIVGKMGALTDASFDERLGKAITDPKNDGFLRALQGQANVFLRPGMVVASTKECGVLGPGWSSYAAASGRFILGAGQGRDRFGQLVSFEPYDKGGEYAHKLTEKELPSHNHTFEGTKVDTGGWGPGYEKALGVGDANNLKVYIPNGTISYSGGNEAHDIMPPYTTLYFCERTS